MNLEYRKAVPQDAAECVVLRGKTRENAVSEARLATLGITSKSWAEDIRTGALPGYICTSHRVMIGYCFGSRDEGEIVVLAVLPNYEGRGIGKALLASTVKDLIKLGRQRLFLGCSSDPRSRSYGFYRRLGWRSTGQVDRLGDEILELIA